MPQLLLFRGSTDIGRLPCEQPKCNLLVSSFWRSGVRAVGGSYNRTGGSSRPLVQLRITRGTLAPRSSERPPVVVRSACPTIAPTCASYAEVSGWPAWWPWPQKQSVRHTGNVANHKTTSNTTIDHVEKSSREVSRVSNGWDVFSGGRRASLPPRSGARSKTRYPASLPHRRVRFGWPRLGCVTRHRVTTRKRPQGCTRP